MIRKYQIGDEKSMRLNKYSFYDGLDWIFHDEDYERFTVEDMQGAKIIFFVSEREDKQFLVFLLMAIDVLPSNIKELTTYFKEKIALEKPKEVLTYSIDEPVVDRWHKFLGFSYVEGSDIVLEGKQLKKWVMTWE